MYSTLRINKYKDTFILYSNLLILIGLVSFFIAFNFNMPSTNEWIMHYFLIGSILILSHWTIRLSPSGTYFSMDSPIYLASLFLFGLNLTLLVLVISRFLLVFLKRNYTISMHLVNFSIYTITLIITFHAFTFTSGLIGPFDNDKFYSYFFALIMYFLLNTALVMGYYSLLKKERFISIFLTVIKESIASYMTTLLLSIILMTLIHTNQLFGLLLFVGIVMLVAITFKQHFDLYEELSQKAIKDYLTNLYNHGFFEEELEKLLTTTKATGQPLTLAMFDLDDFKKYNDMHGHYRGDKLLEYIADKIKRFVTNENWLVARYGGEEFAILMPNTTKDEALTFMNDLRKNVNDSYFEGVEIFPYGCISFSVGIAEYDADVFEKSHLIDRADEAMYLAKANGKNQVVVFTHDAGQQLMNDIEKEINQLEQPLSFFLAKDVYTYQHSKRVFKYAVEMGKKLQLPPYEMQTLTLGALIHDVGKIEIPRTILQKKGKLTKEEWDIVKSHVTWGKDIIMQHKHLKHLAPLVELHHERFDGTGYPHGLKGTETPKLARILSIIDAFDAMTTERPYQPTRTFTEGIEELRRCSGTQFDPQFIEPFIAMIEEHYLTPLQTK